MLNQSAAIPNYIIPIKKGKKEDKQGQFIIQSKTKHKTGLVFMKSKNKQTQMSKLRIPVLDTHSEVE